MDYIVAAIMAGFAVLIVVVLFRRHRPGANANNGDPSSNNDPFAGVQRYADQGDIIRYTGDVGHDGAGGEGGDGGND
jgi:hypothetical protein